MSALMMTAHIIEEVGIHFRVQSGSMPLTGIKSIPAPVWVVHCRSGRIWLSRIISLNSPNEVHHPGNMMLIVVIILMQIAAEFFLSHSGFALLL